MPCSEKRLGFDACLVNPLFFRPLRPCTQHAYMCNYMLILMCVRDMTCTCHALQLMSRLRCKTRIHVLVYVHVNRSLYACMHAHMHACTHVCIRVCTHTHVFLCLCVLIYACACMHACMHVISLRIHKKLKICDYKSMTVHRSAPSRRATQPSDSIFQMSSL